MIPEFGYFALILAFFLAFLQSFFPLVGAIKNRSTWMASAKSLAMGQFIFIMLAFFVLAYAFITHDFSVRYVAENSNTLLPLIYRFCAVWGAHEGSLLLWIFMFSLWMVVFAFFSAPQNSKAHARALAILGMISTGFLLFLLSTSNPFARLLINTPGDGRDLNPLLQDPGLVSHPPMLYMGYVGFAIPFAKALASLIEGDLNKEWARSVLPWVLAAWSFLTFGIVLGSWWAYRQLGWGGWWFWDPVENASFMPWLAGVILLHSLMVIEKREAFKAWGVLMAIVAFSLSLLGTFIVRSGVLISVHAFAVDPARGAFVLAFLLCVVGGGLAVYALYGRKINERVGCYWFSREAFLLSNNAGLFAALLTVLIGTLYPLIIQVLGLGRLSVGAPYFNLTFGLLMLPLLFLMGLAPLTYWKKDSPKRLFKQVLPAFITSLLLSLVLTGCTAEGFKLKVFIALFLFTWIASTLITSMRAFNIKKIPTFLAHFGVAVCLIGIVLNTSYSQEKDVRMKLGDTLDMAGYQFKLLNVQGVEAFNYKANEAVVAVSQKKHSVAILKPQMRLYIVQNTLLPKADIHANLFRDVYVTLSEQLEDNAWGLRFYYKPFVRWIWVGGFLILMGGLFSVGLRVRCD